MPNSADLQPTTSAVPSGSTNVCTLVWRESRPIGVAVDQPAAAPSPGVNQLASNSLPKKAKAATRCPSGPALADASAAKPGPYIGCTAVANVAGSTSTDSK